MKYIVDIECDCAIGMAMALQELTSNIFNYPGIDDLKFFEAHVINSRATLRRTE